MCMSGEWPATQGAIFKRLPALFTVALISRAAHTHVHTFICACYQTDEVCNAATLSMELSHKANDFFFFFKKCSIYLRSSKPLEDFMKVLKYSLFSENHLTEFVIFSVFSHLWESLNFFFNQYMQPKNIDHFLYLLDYLTSRSRQGSSLSQGHTHNQNF